MTAPTDSPAPLMIVLRQVEGPRWCVVRWRRLSDGFAFVGRVATARPYVHALRAALRSSFQDRLDLAVLASGSRVRPFDPKRDVLQEPTA